MAEIGLSVSVDDYMDDTHMLVAVGSGCCIKQGGIHVVAKGMTCDKKLPSGCKESASHAPPPHAVVSSQRL